MSIEFKRYLHTRNGFYVSRQPREKYMMAILQAHRCIDDDDDLRSRLLHSKKKEKNKFP